MALIRAAADGYAAKAHAKVKAQRPAKAKAAPKKR